MSEIIPFSIQHDKPGKGNFYAFKYSDLETQVAGLTQRPVYLNVHFSIRRIHKFDAMQKRGEWYLIHYMIPSYLSAHLPDANAVAIDFWTYTLPHQLFLDSNIDRQKMRQTRLDLIRTSLETAIKLDKSSLMVTLSMPSKALQCEKILGSTSNLVTIPLEDSK